MGKSCLYLKRPSEVDQDVLRELVGNAFAHLDGRTLTS
jgi:predicted HTH transcriptional regulator